MGRTGIGRRSFALAAIVPLLVSACGDQAGNGMESRQDPTTPTAASSSSAGVPGGTAARFDVVAATPFSGRTAAGVRDAVLASSRAELMRLWDEHASTQVPPPDMPDVDFTRSVVLGVFDNAPGPLTLTAVTLDDRTIVAVARKEDTSACPRPQVIEHNAVIATVAVPPQAVDDVRLELVEERADCA